MGRSRWPLTAGDLFQRARRAGPVRLAAKLGLPASTVGAVLRREQLPRLAELDRITGELIRSVRHSQRRYQHREPGSLLHVDVKKLGRIPDGGGWRVHGREVAGPTQHRTSRGWDYIHVAIDDCTRLAYAEILPDEKGESCAQFLHRAAAWFRDRGVTIRRVLTDNAWPTGTAATEPQSVPRCRSGAASPSPATPGPTARLHLRFSGRSDS